jgi:alpha-D-ribose 1-methylphosphonate 5-triphosphate synthase subunit PhnG
MNRKRRCKVLIDGNSKIAEQLAAVIKSNYKINVLDVPNNGLVMVKMRENAKQSLFYIGEVAVIEARVEVQGSIGLGVVIGADSQLAYNLAIIDAAYNANIPEILSWREILLAEEGLIEKKIKSKTASILKTKVDFETMDV